MLKKLMLYCKREGPKRLVLRVVRRAIQLCRILFYRALSDVKLSHNQAIIKQPVLLTGKGRVSLLECQIGVWPSPGFFSTYAHIEARNEEAFILIGKNSCLNNNATIIADRTSIEIGENVKIGHNSFICDSDFHGTRIENRNDGNHGVAPVKIENNVFIGSNVTILKGVNIGKNAVISTGSVVVNDIPENCVAGGIPAKVFKKL
jgi:maltose O-acetyltransferase